MPHKDSSYTCPSLRTIDQCNTLAFKDSDVNGPCQRYQKEVRSHIGQRHSAKSVWKRK